MESMITRRKRRTNKKKACKLSICHKKKPTGWGGKEERSVGSTYNSIWNNELNLERDIFHSSTGPSTVFNPSISQQPWYSFKQFACWFEWHH